MSFSSPSIRASTSGTSISASSRISRSVLLSARSALSPESSPVAASYSRIFFTTGCSSEYSDASFT